MVSIDGDSVRNAAPPRFEDQADRAVYLAAEYKLPITISVIAGVVLLLSGRWSLPEIPPIYRLGLIGVVIGLLPSYVVGQLTVVKWFIDDPRHKVAVVDLVDKSIDVVKVPRALWDDRLAGERSPWQPENGNVDFVVTELEYMEDINKLSVEGVNPELVDPIDMIVRDQRIAEIHGDLQTTAAEFERYKARERTRRLERDREIVTSLIAAVEHGLEFEPGTEERIQDDSLDEFSGETADRSEANRTDTADEPETPTLNQMLGYEAEQLGNGDTPTATDGGSEP
jgi:hypothetical protein